MVMEPADNVDLEAGRMNVNRALDLDKDNYFSGMEYAHMVLMIILVVWNTRARF